MKNKFKWVLIVILVGIFAVDMAGFWKYKLNGTKYEIQATSDSAGEPEEEDKTVEIEYTEISSDDLNTSDRIFITNIDKVENEYEVKGIKYSELTVTKEEYNDLKANKKVTISDVEYKLDKIKSNNLVLKSDDEKAKDIYVKYDATTKKYLVKDNTTDYNIYESTEEYVKVTVDGTTTFTIQEGASSSKKTVANVESSYKNVQQPNDEVKINLATLTFNKAGKCTAITQINR